jgi:hypothetical protein
MQYFDHHNVYVFSSFFNGILLVIIAKRIEHQFGDMLVKDNPNYRKLTQKKIQNKKLPKDLKPVLKCDKNSLKFLQLFNIRNAILCKYSFPNLGGSMFVENWP